MSNVQKLKKRNFKKFKIWSLLLKTDFSCYRWQEQEDCNGNAIIKPDNGFGLWVRV